jgi:hypothetical protein
VHRSRYGYSDDHRKDVGSFKWVSIEKVKEARKQSINNCY